MISEKVRSIVSKYTELGSVRPVEDDDILLTELNIHPFDVFAIEIDIENVFGVVLRAQDIESAATVHDVIRATEKAAKR